MAVLLLAYDFETTGLPNWDEPSNYGTQPHIVQLCACLVDVDTRKTIQSINLIATPYGWEIPKFAADIHGVTTEYASQVGVPEPMIVEALFALSRHATFRIAYNESFDQRIMRIGLKRFFQAGCDPWKAQPTQCVMQMARTAMGIGKRPKLEDAYLEIMGKPLENSHSAAADTMACLDIYWKVQHLATELLEDERICVDTPSREEIDAASKKVAGEPFNDDLPFLG